MTAISNKATYLSSIDRRLLKTLLTPNGRYSSKALARKLGIPATTVQRRRKRLEDEFLTVSYSLDLTKFGWHKADFLIATESGETGLVGKSLLKREEVIYDGKSSRRHTMTSRTYA